MIRTQVYLTSLEKQKLNLLGKTLAASQSELIRQAIDEFIKNKLTLDSEKDDALKAAKGLWANRNDLPNFTALRKEFNDRIKK